jgi:hypothetical protein
MHVASKRASLGFGEQGSDWVSLFDIHSRRDLLTMSTNQQKMMVWLQAQVDGYKGVVLDNFHTSWRDGLAFCALVHSLSPRSGIKFDELSAANASDNLTLGKSFVHLGPSELTHSFWCCREIFGRLQATGCGGHDCWS